MSSKNDISITKFDLLCRICLESESDLKYLFQGEAANMLNTGQFMEVFENDGLPAQICDKCEQELIQSYAFKQKCSTAQSTLQKLRLIPSPITVKDELITEPEGPVLEDHQLNDEDNITLSCTHCKSDFPSKYGLVIHECLPTKDNVIKKSGQKLLHKLLEDIPIQISDSNIKREVTIKDEGLQLLDEHRLSCTTCRSYFPSQSELDEHECSPRNVSSTTQDLTPSLNVDPLDLLPYKCSKCKQSFSEFYDLRLHESAHAASIIKCIVCKRSFCTRNMLMRHVKIHMVGKPLISQECRKQPKETNHICEECGSRFKERRHLAFHMRSHTGGKPFACSECDESFPTLTELKMHNTNHTGENICSICGIGYARAYSLKLHLQTHMDKSGEKLFACDKCTKRFLTLPSLNRHMLSHTGEKPYKCHICPKTFTQSGQLTIHIRTHTGEKPYICPTCGKGFNQSSSLFKHGVIHTGKKSHACEKCTKRFSLRSNLNRHLKTHRDE